MHSLNYIFSHFYFVFLSCYCIEFYFNSIVILIICYNWLWNHCACFNMSKTLISIENNKMKMNMNIGLQFNWLTFSLSYHIIYNDDFCNKNQFNNNLTIFMIVEKCAVYFVFKYIPFEIIIKMTPCRKQQTNKQKTKTPII